MTTDELLGIRIIEVSKPYCFCSECGKLIIGDGYSGCDDNYSAILCAECEGDLNEQHKRKSI